LRFFALQPFISLASRSVLTSARQNFSVLLCGSSRVHLLTYRWLTLSPAVALRCTGPHGWFAKTLRAGPRSGYAFATLVHGCNAAGLVLYRMTFALHSVRLPHTTCVAWFETPGLALRCYKPRSHRFWTWFVFLTVRVYSPFALPAATFSWFWFIPAPRLPHYCRSYPILFCTHWLLSTHPVPQFAITVTDSRSSWCRLRTAPRFNLLQFAITHTLRSRFSLDSFSGQELTARTAHIFFLFVLVGCVRRLRTPACAYATLRALPVAGCSF